MPREVNPDKLYELLDRMMNPNRSGPIKIDLDAAFPKVAEPEQPTPDSWTHHEYWTCAFCEIRRDIPPTAPHDHATCRARTRKHPTPSEPVIDEAVVAEGREARRAHYERMGLTIVMSTLDEAAEKSAITAAVLKDRELRSKACGSSAGSSSSSSASPTGSACSSATSTAAPAADPRRLTQDEILDFWDGPLSRDDFVRAVRGIESIIREATAAAKPVTISEKSANEMYRWIESGQCQHEDFYFWLDRNGVEVAE